MPASLPGALLALPPILFMLAVGACVGSFLNVVAWRLPRGEGLFRPGSRCPACDTPLSWRDNLPILGWLLLRGRCRYCRSPIAPDYLLVEIACALLFAGALAAWFPNMGTGFGPTPQHAPEWVRAGMLAMWPAFVLVLLLAASLLAMTLIDARTFTIPIAIPWLLTAAAFIAHPLHAYAVAASRGSIGPWAAHPWTIWTPPPGEPALLGAIIGAAGGLALAVALLWTGLMPRSFADFEAWEREATRAAEPHADRPEPATPPAPQPSQRLGPVLVRTLLFTGPGVALMAVGLSVGLRVNQPLAGMAVGLIAGLVIGAGLRSLAPDPAPPPEPAPAAPPDAATPPTTAPTAPADAAPGPLFYVPLLLFPLAGATLSPAHAAIGAALGLIALVMARGQPTPPGAAHPAAHETPHFLEYPHARREMLKELLFLLPVALGAWLGWRFLPGGIGAALAEPPLWAQALAGSVLGYLVGGGLVWLVRIGGSLAFGREAMGMGDVHLMAAVGAVLGWIDPTLAFFAAPALGLGWALLGALSDRFARRPGEFRAAMPYGPHLALATLVVVFAKPWFETLLGALLGGPIDLP